MLKRARGAEDGKNSLNEGSAPTEKIQERRRWRRKESEDS
jgi:hypothetical protein